MRGKLAGGSLAILMIGCGSVDALPRDAALPQDAAPPDGPPVVFRDCEDVKQTSPSNGFYLIDYRGRVDRALVPFEAYCVFDDGLAREYLALDTHRDTANYTDFVMDPPRPDSDLTCPCPEVRTAYPRVALRISARGSLEVNGVDDRFAVVPDADQRQCLRDHRDTCPAPKIAFPGYATAEACHTSREGTANIDLRGTPFHIAGLGLELTGFAGDGFATPSVPVTGRGKMYSAERKQLDLFATGYCGYYAPLPAGPLDPASSMDLPLQLEQDR